MNATTQADIELCDKLIKCVQIAGPQNARPFIMAILEQHQAPNTAHSASQLPTNHADTQLPKSIMALALAIDKMAQALIDIVEINEIRDQ